MWFMEKNTFIFSTMMLPCHSKWEYHCSSHSRSVLTPWKFSIIFYLSLLFTSPHAHTHHTHMQGYTNTHTNAHTYTQTHTHTLAHKHTCVPPHLPIHTCECTFVHACTHTHTHTHHIFATTAASEIKGPLRFKNKKNQWWVSFAFSGSRLTRKANAQMIHIRHVYRASFQASTIPKFWQLQTTFTYNDCTRTSFLVISWPSVKVKIIQTDIKCRVWLCLSPYHVWKISVHKCLKAIQC